MSPSGNPRFQTHLLSPIKAPSNEAVIAVATMARFILTVRNLAQSQFVSATTRPYGMAYGR
jgi:hypothetical protein